MKNKLKVFICVLLGLFSFSIGCFIGKKIQIKEFNEKGINNVERVFMIYMAGANLETDMGLASNDLDGIDNLENTKIVLIAGGAKEWKNDYIDENKTSIYEYINNKFVEVKKQDISNLGDSETLSNFLNYTFNNYKADEYSLMFWNHGGAIDGSEYDELQENDNLKLTEIKDAFESSEFKNKKLELVIFRTCLNSTIEVASTLKDYANFMVASEDVTWGSNKSLSVFEFLNNVDKDSYTIDIAKSYIKGYRDSIVKICKMSNFFEEDDDSCVNVTYSITNLNKIDNVNNEVDEFFKSVKNKVNSNYDNLSKIRANLSQYAQDSQEYDMIDLYNLVENYKDYGNNYEDVIEAIDEAIMYNYSNNNYSHGLSIYFPYNSEIFLKEYDDIKTSSNYLEFLNNFKSYKDKSAKTVFSFSNLKKENVSESGADFEYELSDEEVQKYAKAKMVVYLKNDEAILKEKDSYWNDVGTYRALYVSNDIELDGNILKAKVRDRALRVTNSKNETCWLQLNEVEHDNDTYKYETYATLENVTEWNFDSVKLNITIDEKHPDGVITSTTYLKKDTSKQDKLSLSDMIKVDYNDYEYIAIAQSSFYITLDENGRYVDRKSDGIITGIEYDVDDFKLEKEPFSDEHEYYAVFYVYDTAGNVSYSPLVKIN